jgi:hypothetical protein
VNIIETGNWQTGSVARNNNKSVSLRLLPSTVESRVSPMAGLLSLPWADGFVESQKLLTAFAKAIANGDGSGETTRVPMTSNG